MLVEIEEAQKLLRFIDGMYSEDMTDFKDGKIKFQGRYLKDTAKVINKMRFYANSCCAMCGKPATHMELTPINGTFSIEYCNVDEKGDVHYMTKDHIIPKSKGGQSCPDNYQVMCGGCNVLKGSATPAAIRATLVSECEVLEIFEDGSLKLKLNSGIIEVAEEHDEVLLKAIRKSLKATKVGRKFTLVRMFTDKEQTFLVIPKK